MKKEKSKNLKKSWSALIKRREFLPSLILIIATIIIIIVGTLFTRDPSKVKVEPWTVKTGIYLPIEITSFSPESSSTSGTKIEITGQGFAKGQKFYLGSKNNIHQRNIELKTTYINDKNVTAIMPAHPAEEVDLYTIYNGNIVTAEKQFTYTGELPKSSTSVEINSIEPSEISLANKGTVVTIKGKGFSALSVVNFGIGQITDFQADDSAIIFTLPESISKSEITYPITPALYDISVTTKNEESNLATVKITP